MEEIKNNDLQENNEELQEGTAEEEMALMQRELEEARTKSEEATDKMMRLAAEFDNYKKRSAREYDTFKKYANENILKELIPIIDNFERAIGSASESNDPNSLLDGIKLILNQMVNLLEKQGVKQIKAVGEAFDPNIHEAVLHINSDEYPENVVTQELQKGYILGERVLRPAMVAVSKGK